MNDIDSVLLTDLYELTMLEAWHAEDANEVASFEFFVRRLPSSRNFLMAAGLEQVIQYLETLHFSAADLSMLEATGRFSAPFLASLEDLHFTGTVEAMPEGTAFFDDEPILRITAPMREAQLVESRVMNLLHYQTLVASKAARVVLAAAGKEVVDFGLRRAHGAEAGLLSARASYLAGFAGTATQLAGGLWGIPTFGTMAHSYVQAHHSELEAFERFARSQPRNATLLLDTYDTEAAARKVVELGRRLARDGIAIRGVRLDSGDLAAHATQVRAILDEGGMHDTTIFASGNLDEYRLRDLMECGAPIDGFGVGTRMNTSADAPYLDCAYKLVEYAGEPRRKRSEGKATLPGCKQVFRRRDAAGRIEEDCLALACETLEGAPLLGTVMRDGQRCALPALDELRAHAARELASLPARLRGLNPAQPFRAIRSAPLEALVARMDRAAEVC
ncbi:nicotinate phosphoribosyltransferase [Paraburkholderia lycopersici]|uniref:Nicotinate phosphoribosyltransferase n=1 Tax=Paraburkholderia lycopersici TaxID=416944 RepID=A0A1G6X2U6_9BURK|nr:nicotinate phosphoribosyltransferase [Paraburkholderia lycopersici]SDD72530.1 nicotinate phosphoribosyltransferase [Paraburkholderia lycopersici]